MADDLDPVALAAAVEAARDATENPFASAEKVATAMILAYEKARWRPIAEAPHDRDVEIWTPEGLDISRYSERREDGPDDMGHDAGWWGVCTPADPGRSMGNPEYRREPSCQPTHFRLLGPEPADD